jgi:peptidoglycan/xylan/chitin deacetylase (PgdA/CDA1 family)
MFKKLYYLLTGVILISGCTTNKTPVGQTSITEWQGGKTGAVSITYDDGIRTQFSAVLPIMEQMHLPGTFFVITGPIIGSHYPSKFIGRPIKDIISSTAKTPTDSDNFFERASAARYLGYKGSLAYYDRADDYYESGKKDKAYKLMDTLYQKVRSGALPHGYDTSMEIANEIGLSWDTLKAYASRGYEIASHTITHEHLAIMNTANMMYELRGSQQDILEHLGPKYTFSAEVPFGIDDPRVMKAALPVYPALRNLMPEPYMTEINRGDPAQPGASDKEYVQWQRGPVSKTSLNKMESWVDTTLAHNNIWLVLVIHGIDGVGWEPLTHQVVQQYFQFIKDHENKLWVATFQDAAKYMRERMTANLNTQTNNDTVTISLRDSLDNTVYDVPLTLKTYIPHNWTGAQIQQGNSTQQVKTMADDKGNYVLYNALPNATPIVISEEK